MSTWPPLPTGTVTALAPVQPLGKLRLDAVGRGTPVGYTVRKLPRDGAVAVTLRTTADTPLSGTPPRPVTCRWITPPEPSGVVVGTPIPARVSSSRSGWSGTYVPLALGVPATLNPTVRCPVTVLSGITTEADCGPVAVGCAVTLIVQVCAYETELWEQVSAVTVNAPGLVPVRGAAPRVSLLDPYDVMVTVCAVVASPTGTLPKPSPFGSTFAAVYPMLECQRISPFAPGQSEAS